MDCSGVGALINRYIDGELGYVETAEFQQHLDFCPDCALELRELGAVRGVLARWGEARIAPAPDFADRVMAAVGREPLPGTPRPLSEVVDEALERLDRTLGKVPLPGGRTIPVKNLIGWGLAVAAVVIGFERRHDREESEVRVP
jgi:anti-sigma factor RsiW